MAREKGQETHIESEVPQIEKPPEIPKPPETTQEFEEIIKQYSSLIETSTTVARAEADLAFKRKMERKMAGEVAEKTGIADEKAKLDEDIEQQRKGAESLLESARKGIEEYRKVNSESAKAIAALIDQIKSPELQASLKPLFVANPDYIEGEWGLIEGKSGESGEIFRSIERAEDPALYDKDYAKIQKRLETVKIIETRKRAGMADKERAEKVGTALDEYLRPKKAEAKKSAAPFGIELGVTSKPKGEKMPIEAFYPDTLRGLEDERRRLQEQLMERTRELRQDPNFGADMAVLKRMKELATAAYEQIKKLEDRVL